MAEADFEQKSKHCIMVVDDEPLIVSILQRFLKAAGFKVIPAVGGDEAMEVLGSGTKIDMMIVDLKMPNISGVEVIDEGKKREIPFIIFSGQVYTEESIAYLRSLGYDFNDMFSKPVDLYRLLEVVKRKLGQES